MRAFGLITALALLLPGHLTAQEIILEHRAGERVRIEGMSVREFASELRLTSRDREAFQMPSQCFVALVDSEGNVWEEYTSPVFTPEDGELRGACVPRIPMTDQDRFHEGQMMLPWSEGVPAEDVVFGGMVDWEFVTKWVDAAVPDLDGYLLKGEVVTRPPYVIEESGADWAALFFLVAPAGEESDYPVGPVTTPIMILMGVNR